MAVFFGIVFEKGKTSKRIPNARITFTLAGPNKTFRTRSNQSGIYNVNVTAGEYFVTVGANNYINYSSSPNRFNIRSGRQKVNISLTPIRQQSVKLASQPMVVDSQFNSFSTMHLLKDRARLADLALRRKPTVDRKPELPITPDGRLASGVLYESSNTAKLRYYLPEYVLRIVNSQYTTRLKFRDTDDDPHGPVAFLTIEFIAASPEDRRFRLKEIEHEAVVFLSYSVDILSDDPGPSTPSDSIDDFAGKWVNVDRKTRGMTRLNITRKTGSAGTFHGFGRCHPEDCDWGEIPTIFSGEQMTGVYRFGFKDTHITVRRSGENLHATVFNDYAEGDRRSDRTNDYILRRKNLQPEPTHDKPTLSIEIGAVEKVSQTVRRCRLDIHSKEEYDRIFQIMSDPGHNARLEVRSRATMGYRTWRQIFVGNVFEATHMKPVSVIDLNPAVVKHLPSIIDDEKPASKPRKRIRPNLTIAPNIIPTVTGRSRPSATLHRNISPALTKVIKKPSPHLASDIMRVSEEISRAAPRPNRRVVLHPSVPQKIKVPSRVLVDKRGAPIITRREVSSTDTISPFWFNLETHAYMFDIPETPTTRHVLLKRDIFVADSSVTFFQDSIIREQVYYEPQAFHLPRIDTEPYAPDLLFAFNDVSEEGEGDAVTVDYRVRLAYRVRPYIDQRFFAQARLEFKEGATFSALTPKEATLVVHLPSDEAETWIPVTRSEAEISLDEGIIDEIELTSGQFQKVFSAFQSPATIGIEGTVKVALFDGSDIDIPVQVSLQENTGTLFDSHFEAAGSPGQYNLTLTNHIESPVSIHRADPVVLGAGVVASPAGLSLPVRVAPGASTTIIYNVSPPDTLVTTITPLLETTIDVNYERLWSLITVNQGFVKRTFDVQVSIQPQFFSATPAGMEPLTSVVVEFDSFVTVELTPQQTALTVPLRMPLLPVLLNQLDTAQTYRFRIINQHENGPGAMGDWTAGSGNLQVVPPRGD